jgi:hypothetical protein
VSRPTPDRPDDDDPDELEVDDEDRMARLVSEAGDPRVEPRPEHVAALRTRLLDRLGPPRAVRPWTTRWLVVGSGLAAAGLLLAVFAWPRHDLNDPEPGSGTSWVARQPLPQPPDDATWLATARNLDGANPATFNWPIPETSALLVSSPIPPDLLD